jgi:hypothetical protein
MIYLKDKQTNEIKTFEVDNYLQLSKNIRDQYIEATKEEINDYLLQEAKNKKITELEVFHESDEARILTINEKFQVSTNYEKTRKWFNEIINDLENESDVTGKSHNDITFEWEIAIGVWLPLKLSQLKQFKYAVFNITRTNFKQYRTHTKAIESLTTRTKVKSYDFKKGYLLNNKLNFDI